MAKILQFPPPKAEPVPEFVRLFTEFFSEKIEQDVKDFALRQRRMKHAVEDGNY